MNEVMRNAQTFLDLLQAAKTEKAGHWNQQALQRAMQWAEYFEGVYKKLSSKPAVIPKFDRGLSIINSQPGAAPGSVPVTFDQLKQSRRLLMKILLQNPYLNSDLYSVVLDQYTHLPTLADGTTGRDMLTEDATQCAHAKAVRETLLKIKMATSKAVERNRGMAKGGSTTCLTDVEIRTDAVLLHEHLLHHLSTDPSSQSTLDYLDSKLHEVASQPSGVDIITAVVNLHASQPSNMDDTSEAILTKCNKIVSNWLKQHSTKYLASSSSTRR